ncbi:MAG: sigma-70 family RNA polymerase sigma factor [Candidatus Paceibacterota bacterium]|jgi:RNA polymerase sigma-70 factor (ECF subfamily)
MLDNEQNIIEKAIHGDEKAFGLLYSHYQPQIYRFIYIKLSKREEAEDLTHQVFLKAWQSIERFTYQKLPLSSWLYRIARNQVIDVYRTQKIELDIEEVPEIASEDKKVEDKIDLDEEVKKIRTAIRQLNPDQQDVIIMRYIEELSPQEIALALKKTPTAVRIIQHRALKSLRNILEK